MKKNHLRIRALSSCDWNDVKHIRLKSLKDHHGIFGLSYEEEKVWKDDQWKTFLNTDNQKIYGLYDQKKLIGIAGVFIFKKHPDIAWLGMNYILPEYRGHKLSSLLFQKRFDWIDNKTNIVEIRVSHRAGNVIAEKMIKSHGFKHFETQTRVWPDGEKADEPFYRIILK